MDLHIDEGDDHPGRGLLALAAALERDGGGACPPPVRSPAATPAAWA
ncbi:hypothetical protein [Synechococcus sp. RSCCF101]|nr:hypothetical protein [Synechococcus sp. RSCCF101]